MEIPHDNSTQQAVYEQNFDEMDPTYKQIVETLTKHEEELTRADTAFLREQATFLSPSFTVEEEDGQRKYKVTYQLGDPTNNRPMVKIDPTVGQALRRYAPKATELDTYLNVHRSLSGVQPTERTAISSQQMNDILALAKNRPAVSPESLSAELKLSDEQAVLAFSKLQELGKVAKVADANGRFVTNPERARPASPASRKNKVAKWIGKYTRLAGRQFGEATGQGAHVANVLTFQDMIRRGQERDAGLIAEQDKYDGKVAEWKPGNHHLLVVDDGEANALLAAQQQEAIDQDRAETERIASGKRRRAAQAQKEKDDAAAAASAASQAERDAAEAARDAEAKHQAERTRLTQEAVQRHMDNDRARQQEDERDRAKRQADAEAETARQAEAAEATRAAAAAAEQAARIAAEAMSKFFAEQRAREQAAEANRPTTHTVRTVTPEEAADAEIVDAEIID